MQIKKLNRLLKEGRGFFELAPGIVFTAAFSARKAVANTKVARVKKLQVVAKAFHDRAQSDYNAARTELGFDVERLLIEKSEGAYLDLQSTSEETAEARVRRVAAINWLGACETLLNMLAVDFEDPRVDNLLALLLSRHNKIPA